MNIQVTVGDNSEWPDVDGARGTVTVALAKQDCKPGQPRVKIATIHLAQRCSVELTIAEADVLQNALEMIVFDAGMIAFDESPDPRGAGRLGRSGPDECQDRRKR